MAEVEGDVIKRMSQRNRAWLADLAHFLVSGRSGYQLIVHIALFATK